MSASQVSPSGAPASIHLRVARAGKFDVDAAGLALTDLAWLGRPADGLEGQPGARRIAVDLELPVRDGSSPSPVRKAALIDLGQPQVEDAGFTLAVSWQSATLAPLFPVFIGQLRVGPSGLVVDGRYTPPFGRLGLVIDATLLRFVARRTAQAFLERVAAHLDGLLPADNGQDPLTSG